MLALSAPYCYLHNVKTIYFPATYTEKDQNILCASNPEIDNQLTFMNTKIIHEGFEYTRLEKTKQICDYRKTNKVPVALRVCYQTLKGDNCCVCEKCSRTMMSILSFREDPRNYGFKIVSNTYDRMKYHMDSHSFPKGNTIPFWKEIQKSFHENGFQKDSYFGWFLDYQFDEK
jgi:hypothetical protein